jgi:small subunit ribosomal protein S6
LVGDRLKEYELLFIVSPRVPADDVPAAVDRVAGLVTSGGGEVLSTDNWGRRRLAYPIKHYFEGTYVLFTLRMPAAAAAPLEASLIISEEVIRHLLTEGIIPPANRERDRDRERGFSEDRERPAAPAAVLAAVEAPVAVAEPPSEPAPAEAVTAEPAPAEAAPPEASADTETAATEPAPAATE